MHRAICMIASVTRKASATSAAMCARLRAIASGASLSVATAATIVLWDKSRTTATSKGARSIGGVGGRRGIMVSESVTRRSGAGEEIGTIGTGGWDDVLGGKYGLHLSVEEVTLWMRLLVWGVVEAVLLVDGSVGNATAGVSTGHSGSAMRRRSGSTSGGRSSSGAWKHVTARVSVMFEI